MQMITAIGSLFALSALLSCSEWRTFVLKNPQTGAEAVCAVHWGSLTDEDVQRLRECIAACEARGFHPRSPEDVPRFPWYVRSNMRTPGMIR